MSWKIVYKCDNIHTLLRVFHKKLKFFLAKCLFVFIKYFIFANVPSNTENLRVIGTVGHIHIKGVF